MHDLNYFRDHLDVFADMAKKRGTVLDLDAFRKLDKERRELITATEQLKAVRNRASEEIARLKKEKQNADSLISDMKQVSERVKQSDERIADLDATQRELLLTIPNTPHSSVPVGASAADNQEVRRWGAPPKFDFAPKPHWEVGERAGILDLAVATKITGARFAVYKGWGARLERALANFFLDVHTREHGYTEILPPFLVNTASLTGAGQLPKFAADLFKLENTDFWLPPRSEFRKISSSPNCEAFQSRRAGIRLKPKGGGKSDFVHTLNGSGLAVGRTWIAVVENYQQADGSILIPEVLRPYMGIDRIPSVG